ncbi:hypothetical protein HK096_004305, partial [Nowakowskiella sp. JEL0078]
LVTNAIVTQKEDEHNLVVKLSKLISNYCFNKLVTRIGRLVDSINLNKLPPMTQESCTQFYDHEYQTEQLDYNGAMMISSACSSILVKINASNEEVDSWFLGRLIKASQHYKYFNSVACCGNPRYMEYIKNVKLITITTPSTSVTYQSWRAIAAMYIDAEEDVNRLLDDMRRDRECNEKLQQEYGSHGVLGILNRTGSDSCRVEYYTLAYVYKKTNHLFISVSKMCCQMCSLCIETLKDGCVNVVVRGRHKKIYSNWGFPKLNYPEKNESILTKIIYGVDKIVRDELSNYTKGWQESDSYRDGLRDEPIVVTMMSEYL